jgi:hypothetical protein
MNKSMSMLILLAFFLSSCASATDTQKVADDEPFFDPPATAEAAKREPVFVYKDQTANTSKKVSLRLNGEPVLLTSGYVRLAGVVSGGRPIALVEVGGRALALRNGDTVSGYQVLNIVNDQISMLRKEEKECGE